MTDTMTTKKPRKKKEPYPFPGELIDQLLAQVQDKNAESIPGDSGLACQLKKMLAERMLAAELTHHLANEDATSKSHRNGTMPKKVLAPDGELQLDIPRDRLRGSVSRLISHCHPNGSSGPLTESSNGVANPRSFAAIRARSTSAL